MVVDVWVSTHADQRVRPLTVRQLRRRRLIFIKPVDPVERCHVDTEIVRRL